MTYLDWNMNNRKQLHEFLWNHIGGTLNNRPRYGSDAYLMVHSGTHGLHALLFFGLESMIKAELYGNSND